MEAHDEGRAFGLSARRQLYRTVSADEPALTFSGVKLRFENYLWSEPAADYDLALLDAWVRYVEQYPLSFDERRDRDILSAYYHRFTETCPTLS